MEVEDGAIRAVEQRQRLVVCVSGIRVWGSRALCQRRLHSHVSLCD